MKIMQSRGFTLIELMVTVAVLAIVAMITLPSFTQTIRNNQLNDDARDLVDALAETRSDAVLRKQGQSLSLDEDEDGAWRPKETVEWSAGQPTETILTYNMMGLLQTDENLCFVLEHKEDSALKVVILARRNGTVIYDKSLSACPSNLGNE